MPVTFALDGTVLGVAIVTALASILGGVAGAFVTTRHERKSERERAAEESRTERRDAYVELLTLIDQLKAAIDGATFLPGAVVNISGSERTQPLLVAGVTVELLAPPDTWGEIRPLRDAVIAQANHYALAQAEADPSLIEESRRLIRSLGLSGPEGWQRLRQRYLEAVRADLAR